MMKAICSTIVLLASACVAVANTAPTVTIQSAAMRPDSTLMDVVYQITDPDDATVKVRALAFVDGIRSFENVLRPVTFVEGTETNLGDAIATGVDHTLTWNVAADWSIDLGQVKFEVLCLDGRGMLEIDWVTLPAAGGSPELTISKNTPSDEAILDGLLWQFASGDPGLVLENGELRGSESSGVFEGLPLFPGREFYFDSVFSNQASAYLYKAMDLKLASAGEERYAIAARAGLSGSHAWYALNQPYEADHGLVVGWGGGPTSSMIPGLYNVVTVAAGGDHALAIDEDGSVIGWGLLSGRNPVLSPGAQVPAGLDGVTSVAAGYRFSLAAREDGSVVGWGNSEVGQLPPAGLSDVVGLAAGIGHGVALKSDGTVVAWGRDSHGQAIPPSGLTDVISIAAEHDYSLALKSDGTIVGWGEVPTGTPPDDVIAISAGFYHYLALKSDGTVVNVGGNFDGDLTPPAGLTNVVEIAAGTGHSVALKGDGSVIVWGDERDLPLSKPTHLTNVESIASSRDYIITTIRKTADPAE